jgi:putative ABC transport system permease protein
VIALAFSFARECLNIAFRNMSQRRTRSTLTIVGIVIGIAAVVALISIGLGATSSITSQLGGLGGNKLIVFPGTFGGGFGAPSSPKQITDKEVKLVSNVQGIEVAAGLLTEGLQINYRTQTYSASVMGADPKLVEHLFGQVQGFSIGSGRFLREGDKNDIVIGYIIATKVFHNQVMVGNKFKINKTDFKIVGITKETGLSQNDNLILMPIDSLRSISGAPTNTFTYIISSVQDINNIDQTAKRVQTKLDNTYGKKSFTALTTSQLASNISAIFSALTVLLAGIAGISLVVAAVGISNTMLMSVMERTREIGVMKAIGATSKSIIEIFLTEAMLIGFLGGVAGVGLGYLVSLIINQSSVSFGFALTTSVPWYLAVGGVGLAVLVGTTSGLIPARKAAKLQPVEALRYE